MKKLLSIALCAAAAAAFADEVISLGQVGVTKIAAQANTIIAVSYQDLAGGDVAISNLVKTTNLAAGDQMAVFNDGVYETWTLEEGTGGAKYWAKNEKQYTLDGDGKLVEDTTRDAAIVTESVGTGLWIIQKGDTIQDDVYLYGKPSAVETSTTVAGKWTLIGNPLQVAAKPVMSPGSKDDLVEEERFLRYKLHMGELLQNYVTMDKLYGYDTWAIFQTGVLRIDGREMNLCFHVDSEAAHSALVDKSNCCVIYLKLSRPSEKAERLICAVVTAGKVGTLYVGRNGVFYDRDGKDWEAVITKVVENQVSLAEAFWAPWKKIGEGIAGTVKKFIGDKQSKATESVQKGTESTQAGGAAMASSIAAIGIGIGMVGAAAASLMAAISSMPAWKIAVSVVVLVLLVSVPSMILAWFKLRKRDLGVILNACGWAINRPMQFSMKRAAAFTKCAPNPMAKVWFALLVLLLLALGGLMWWQAKAACDKTACDAPVCAEAQV